MSKNKQSFELLIDPPGRCYEKTTAALLYTLESWIKLMGSIDPVDPINDTAIHVQIRHLFPRSDAISLHSMRMLIFCTLRSAPTRSFTTHARRIKTRHRDGIAYPYP